MVTAAADEGNFRNDRTLNKGENGGAPDSCFDCELTN